MRRSSSGEPVSGSTGCFFLPVGALILLWCAVAGIRNARYSSSGVRTMAHVTFSWTTSGRNPRGRCEYEFQANGRTYSGTGGNHSTGEDIPVVYIASNPKENRDLADPDGQAGPLYFFAIVGSALVGAGIYLVRNDTELLND